MHWRGDRKRRKEGGVKLPGCEDKDARKTRRKEERERSKREKLPECEIQLVNVY